MRATAFHCLSRIAVPVFLLWSAASLTAAQLEAIPQLGLRLTRGFRISVFADADMANDIYAMTLDRHGNVVVSSQGYIRTLLDHNNDGVADDSEEFAQTRTGGMGLCFDGNDLLFSGDGGLWRFTDANGDGRADGPPQKLFDLEFAEHGGHAMRRGPDGMWYLIAGNDTKFNMAGRKVEGGALLRFGAGGQGVEVFAQGFRNPYDFDFNDYGDIFTFDSDCERDFFLPWYSPTRIYHVAPVGHHGWRLESYTRSWPRPDYYADAVGILATVGRGSPTGVVCYRHTQFPEYFQNGVFALDWTFGKIYFLPHEPVFNGSTYGGEPQVFLEPMGNQGFAPTDAVVAPDGSLLVSIGGRKTRGAVFRIKYADAERSLVATNWVVLAGTDTMAVLDAPQPLEEWSRDYWVPHALRQGPELFARAAAEDKLSVERRLRAIEVLTELFGGLPDVVAVVCAQSSSPVIRARTAWSLGRVPVHGDVPTLLGLARDSSPYVRTHALQALLERSDALDPAQLQNALAFNMAYADRRVHQAATHLAAVLPEPAFRALWTQQEKSGLPQARLTLALASLWRTGPEVIQTNVINLALTVLSQSKNADHQLDAVRLIILALGDWKLRNPSLEVFTGYESELRLDPTNATSVRIRRALQPLFPSADERMSAESSRLLAMLEGGDAGLGEKLLARLTDRSEPDADFHYLAVLARCRAPLSTNSLPKLAQSILILDRKMDGRELRPKQNWSVRLGELVQTLVQREPRLADALLRDPNLTRAGNVPLVIAIGSARFAACGRIFLGAVRRDAKFPWSIELVDLLSTLPIEETQPLFRQQWTQNFGLRDRLVIELANKPEAADRDKFLAGLASADSRVALASANALLALPRDTSGRALTPTFRQFRSLLDRPKEDVLRSRVLELLSRESGQPLKAMENATDLRRAYQPVIDWFVGKYPGQAREADADDREDPLRWNAFYKTVVWQAGKADRGEDLFNQRGCQICHTGPRPIGPDLNGAASRMSPVDLFNTIIFPSRDVAPAYHTTTFRTRDGSAYTGMVAFESADGVILQINALETLRLAESDIVSRVPSTVSLMPVGLMNGLNAAQFADFYAFLKSGRVGK